MGIILCEEFIYPMIGNRNPNIKELIAADLVKEYSMAVGLRDKTLILTLIEAEALAQRFNTSTEFWLKLQGDVPDLEN